MPRTIRCTPNPIMARAMSKGMIKRAGLIGWLSDLAASVGAGVTGCSVTGSVGEGVGVNAGVGVGVGVGSGRALLGEMTGSGAGVTDTLTGSKEASSSLAYTVRAPS